MCGCGLAEVVLGGGEREEERGGAGGEGNRMPSLFTHPLFLFLTIHKWMSDFFFFSLRL